MSRQAADCGNDPAAGNLFGKRRAVTRKNVGAVRQILAGLPSRRSISLHRRRTNVRSWSTIARTVFKGRTAFFWNGLCQISNERVHAPHDLHLVSP